MTISYLTVQAFISGETTTAGACPCRASTFAPIVATSISDGYLSARPSYIMLNMSVYSAYASAICGSSDLILVLSAVRNVV